MPDQLVYTGLFNHQTGEQLRTLIHDNGDGSWAETVWIGDTITASIGSLQIDDGQDVAEGATTDTAYVSGNGSVVAVLKGIFGKVPAKGSTTGAGSTPVVIASDQAAVASKVADGADVALGAVADTAYATGSGTVIGLLKGLFARLRGGQATMANSLPVTMASDQSAIPVAGTVASLNRATAGSPTVVAIGTGSTSILGANAARKGLDLQNIGANPITIDPSGGTVVAGTGIVLNPQPALNQAGGSRSFDGALVPTGAITGITLVASTNLVVIEYT